MNSPENTHARPIRVAITGASGQLGHLLCRTFGDRAIPLSMKQMDLSSSTQIRAALDQLQPDVLINTAAYTNVDGAEDNPDLCYAINHLAVKDLAQETKQRGCKLVQISTDYVFSNSPQTTPFTEQDPMDAVGVYAKSKVAAETEAQANANHLIVRTCGIYGPPCPHGTRNFVSTMLALGQKRRQLEVVNDQVCNPTYVVELAEAIRFLVDNDHRGTFHVVNREGISWFDLAVETFRIAHIDCQVSAISTADYNAIAPRPPYSVLNTSRYEALHGPKMSTCKQALAAFLATCEATSDCQ